MEQNPSDSISAFTALSRRDFLAVSSAVLLSCALSSVLEGCTDDDDGDDNDIINQPTPPGAEPVIPVVTADQLIEATGFSEHPLADFLDETVSFTLPFGTIVHQVNNDLALALTPHVEGKDLIDVRFLNLHSGNMTSLLTQSVGNRFGHPNAIIYDARASDSLLAWTEYDIANLHWQVYLAVISSDQYGVQTLGNPIALDSGTPEYEVPLMAVAGNKVYWMVMPNPTGSAQYQDSCLKSATPDQSETKTVHVSHGRMITSPLVDQDILTFAPRLDTRNIHYELTAIRTGDDRPIARLVMPQSVRVLDAMYLDGRFCFSIENNYAQAGGLGLYGTYWQLGEDSWLHLFRKPSAPPVLLAGRLVVKSSTRVIAINAEDRSYCSIPPPTDSVDYGDILAGWGHQQRLVVYSNVRSTAALSSAHGMLRVFSPT